MKRIVFLALFFSSLFADEFNMQVFKPVTSTCPPAWLDDMKTLTKDNVDIVSMVNVSGLKYKIGVPRELQSCNTSILNDYVFEGNVPASAIKEFFENMPKDSFGLAMPANQNDKEIKTVFVMYDDGSFKEFGKY